jgi:hypothetical protein
MIDAIFADEDRFHLDGDGEYTLIPCVRILTAFATQLAPHVSGLPTRFEAEDWKSGCLALFDAEIDGLLFHPEHSIKQERRAVIEATFEAFVQVCEQ